MIKNWGISLSLMLRVSLKCQFYLMNICYGQSLTSWKTATDPAHGDFSLQLRLHSGTAKFNEFVLVWRNFVPYWSSGKWDGYSFLRNSLVFWARTSTLISGLGIWNLQ